ncbi:MAG TPA: PRTRC system protein A [Duganella sp.]|nr:PRTRC system protein A [Duganella sp.]
MNAQEFMKQMDHAAELARNAYMELAQTLEASMRSGRQQILAINEEAVTTYDLQLDLALVQAAPVVAAPANCEFYPLQENGHRFVVATNGVYLEARRPWLHFIHQISEFAGVTVPYGSITPKFELAFGRVGTALPQLREFARHAQAAAPLEAAASIIWNSRLDAWRIEFPEIIGEATTASIRFQQPHLADDEHLVIDVHSHGHLDAFFSGVDDADDAGAVKIAGVVGNLDGVPTVAFRVCVLGVMIPLSVPADKIFAD